MSLWHKDSAFLEDLKDRSKLEDNSSRITAEIINIDRRLREVEDEIPSLYSRSKQIRHDLARETNPEKREVLLRQLASIRQRLHEDMEAEVKLHKRSLHDAKKVRDVLEKEGRIEEHLIKELAA